MTDELIPEDPLLTPSRVVSLVIALLYVGLFLAMADFKGVASVCGFLLLPLACIWFPDVMASYTGWGLSQMAITKESPEVFVYYGGWFLLFLPVLAAFISALASW